jgi:outer membrane protein OmpA-like peptidoglycan-associated protein
MKKLVTVAALASTLVVGGCATKTQLSESEVRSRFQPVTALQGAFDASDTSMLSLLAQDNYTQAVEALASAKKLAKQNDPAANHSAAEGRRLLKQAKARTATAQDVFSEVLIARQAAIDSGAFQYAPQEMEKLEADFKSLAGKLERGDNESAKIRRPELLKRYSALETVSLKGATIDKARHTLQQARNQNAHKYASKTFATAENELGLAIKLIDSGKSRKHEAEQHANRAIELAQQAMGITDTVKTFRKNDYSYEEMVLWHQTQLQKAIKPLAPTLSVNKPEQHIITDINQQISQLMQERASLSQQATDNQSQLQKRAALDEASRKRLTFIQNLFDAKEASVYLQKEDVLIRAQGFYFPVGESEITSKNFSLLNKIAQAISQYPDSTIFISGHTDNTGHASKNLTLSRERAHKVAKFLNEFGGIKRGRLRVGAFGEGKPVESNDTPAGRAANRRVEILIQTQS